MSDKTEDRADLEEHREARRYYQDAKNLRSSAREFYRLAVGANNDFITRSYEKIAHAYDEASDEFVLQANVISDRLDRKNEPILTNGGSNE